MNRIHQLMTIAVAAAAPVLAGPPLICHPIEIGAAKSLLWSLAGQTWDGTDKAYDAGTKLVGDTLALLAAATPLPVRMETMRRAAIYSGRDIRLATDLAAKLEARANQTGTALDWFDAGYWIESVRQASFIYRFEMLSAEEKQAWQIRKGLPGKDGMPMVKRAIAIGGSPEMERALGRMEEYRLADERRATFH